MSEYQEKLDLYGKMASDFYRDTCHRTFSHYYPVTGTSAQQHFDYMQNPLQSWTFRVWTTVGIQMAVSISERPDGSVRIQELNLDAHI